MSTETTNKKIKIDNGTTFGRTYTDKAVDELLKNVGGGGISVIELTDKNGTIASAQLGKINANPQNFAFKYSGKILLFARASSTTYQYCNNTTNSSDNNVMTTSTLLTIESSTGVYTIAENAHNVVANSIHPVNGGDLTNIQVGSKVYSIPSGGGKPLLDLSPYYNSDTEIVSQEGMSLLSNKILNNEIVGISLGGEFMCMLLDGVYGATIDFLSRVIGDYGRRVKVSIATEDGKVSQKTEYASLTLPQTAPTSQLIPSITTTNTQQNLTIGDGLTIENGALKTTGSGGGSNVKIFQPPITNVNVSTFDEDKRITVIFDANNEVETYIHSLVDHDKNFSANLFLKTIIIINDYQIRLISPLSLINVKGGNAIFDMCGRLIQSETSKIDFQITFNSTNAALTFYFDNNDIYTQFKQLSSLLFTTDTLLKLTIKTDE